MAFTCRVPGTEPHTHATVALARRHFTDPSVWTCGYLYELRGRYGVEYDGDGERIVLSCNGLRWEIDEYGSSTCENGHEHIAAERRSLEGWEYAEDEQEAAQLARAGIVPVRT